MPTRLTPGCGLCRTFVASPHYCTHALERSHERVVRGNARARAAHDAPVVEAACRAPAIPDLAAWGDWSWAVREGFEPRGVDHAAVRRAARRLARLSPRDRAALWELYVERCDSVRESRRLGKTGNQHTSAYHPPLTVAERAYLSALDGCR